MKTLFSILSVLLLAACSDDFAPSSRLEGLRLIAVQTDKPSAQPGDEVKLTAIYNDSEGRALSWGYALCDGSASSAALDCMRAMDKDSLVVERDKPEFQLTMPAAPSAGKRAVSIGVVVIVCPGEIVPGDTLGVPIACLVDGEPLDVNDFEMGVKRIFFEDDMPNHNPEITALRWDGEPWPSEEVKQVRACARDTDDFSDCAVSYRHAIALDAPDAQEHFKDSNGKDVVEQVVAQFYATGGTFEWDVRTLDSASTRWIAQKSDAGKTLILYFVVRDSRGGVTWETRSVEVSE